MMNQIPVNSMKHLLSSALDQVEAASRKVTSSFDELIGSALELAAAERKAQSLADGGLEDGDDEDALRQVDEALTFCEDAKFGMTGALERTLDELAEQERVLSGARVTLQEIRDTLLICNHELSPAMELGPKPGCVGS